VPFEIADTIADSGPSVGLAPDRLPESLTIHVSKRLRARLKGSAFGQLCAPIAEDEFRFTTPPSFAPDRNQRRPDRNQRIDLHGAGAALAGAARAGADAARADNALAEIAKPTGADYDGRCAPARKQRGRAASL